MVVFKQHVCPVKKPAASDFDHFGDVNEMILDAVAAFETCQPGLLDNPLEFAAISAAQNPGKPTAGPNLRSRIVRSFDFLEGRTMSSVWSFLWTGIDMLA